MGPPHTPSQWKALKLREDGVFNWSRPGKQALEAQGRASEQGLLGDPYVLRGKRQGCLQPVGVFVSPTSIQLLPIICHPPTSISFLNSSPAVAILISFTYLGHKRCDLPSCHLFFGRRQLNQTLEVLLRTPYLASLQPTQFVTQAAGRQRPLHYSNSRATAEQQLPTAAS